MHYCHNYYYPLLGYISSCHEGVLKFKLNSFKIVIDFSVTMFIKMKSIKKQDGIYK